jgi:hypothetical protein
MDFTSCRQNTKERKNLLSPGSLELFGLHNSTLGFNRYTPGTNNSHKHTPGGGGELAADDVDPGLTNKWQNCAIGLTSS